MAKHVLIVGFEPSGEAKVSPSELIARSLEGRLIAGRALSICILPIETRTLRERLEQSINAENPDIIVSLMQFGGRPSLALERVSVNVLDFDDADRAGVTRTHDVITRGGSDARISGMPFELILESWNANGVPGYVSNSAGTYLGNQVLYESLGLAEGASSQIVSGLLHLPYLPAQAIELGAESTPSMSFETMKKGVELMIETIVPWIEHRTPDAKKEKAKGPQMWIPRGVKEVER